MRGAHAETDAHPYNGVGFSDIGFVYVMGIWGASWWTNNVECITQLGDDARKPTRSIPRALLASFATSSVLGWLFIIAAASAIPAVMMMPFSAWSALQAGGASGAGTLGAYEDTAIAAATVDQSVIVYAALGTTAGNAYGIIQIVLAWMDGLARMTVSTRLFFALARDRVMPFSHLLRTTWGPSGEPFGAIVSVALLDVLICCLQLLTPAGYAAVINVALVSLYLSFAAPSLLRACCTRKPFSPPPAFSLGAASVPIHAAAALFYLFLSALMVFPNKWPNVVGDIYTTSVNWTVVVVGGVGVIAATWWVGYARHTFVAPHEWFAAALVAGVGGAEMGAVDCDGKDSGAVPPRVLAMLEEHPPLDGNELARTFEAYVSPSKRRAEEEKVV